MGQSAHAVVADAQRVQPTLLAALAQCDPYGRACGSFRAGIVHHLPADPHRSYQRYGAVRSETLVSEWYRRDGDVISLTLHVQPGAKRTEISGLHGEALKIRLAAPPIEGRANEALLRFIADTFCVPMRQVELKQGGQSRHKVVMVTGSKVAPESVLIQ